MNLEECEERVHLWISGHEGDSKLSARFHELCAHQAEPLALLVMWRQLRLIMPHASSDPHVIESVIRQELKHLEKAKR